MLTAATVNAAASAATPATKKAKKPAASSSSTSAVAAVAVVNNEQRIVNLASTWEGVFNTAQYRLAPKEFMGKDNAGITVRAMCLAPLPIATLKVCTKEAVDAALARQNGSKPGRPMNIICLITEIISTGWSHAPAAGAAPSAVGVKGGKPLTNNNNNGNNASERVARFYGGKKEHALVHVHNTETKGTAVFRTGKTEDYFNVSVGAVLCLPVWATDMLEVFGTDPTHDIPALSMLTLELVSKGGRTANKTAMLTVRRLREAHWLSAASRSIVPFAPNSLLPSNMVEVEQQRLRHTTGTHLLPQSSMMDADDAGMTYQTALKAAGLEHLNQEYIAQNFSKNVALVQVVPKGGQFVIYADGTLRFVIDREIGLGDINCTDEEGTLRVRVDERQLPFMPDFATTTTTTTEEEPDEQLEQLMLRRREWGVAYLNLAMRFGIVELLVAVNSQEARDNSSGPGEIIQFAMARFNIAPLTAGLIGKALPQLPPAIEARFAADYGAAHFQQRMRPFLVAFAIVPPSATTTTTTADTTTTTILHLVVDLRVMTMDQPSAQWTRLQTLRASKTSRTLSTFMHRDDDWKRANEVYVFMEGELKFHAMAPVCLPGGTASATGDTADHKSLLHRLLPSLALPRWPSSMTMTEDGGATTPTIKYEDDDYNTNDADDNDDGDDNNNRKRKAE